MLNSKGKGNTFSRQVLKRLIDQGLSVKALADSIGRPRPTVSTAIHTKRFPRVRKQVVEALDL